MTTIQEKAIEAAKKTLTFSGADTIKNVDITEYEDGSILVQIDTFLEGCKDKIVEMMTEHCFSFSIGKRGAYYRYNRNYHREYISVYDIYAKCQLY